MKHSFAVPEMLKNDRNLARIYDIVALRVIVPSIADCYAALGVIHGRRTPPRDGSGHIAQPKPNGYRSLHTTVFCEDGEQSNSKSARRKCTTMRSSASPRTGAMTKAKEARIGGTPRSRTFLMSQLAEIQRTSPTRSSTWKHLEEIKIDVFKTASSSSRPKATSSTFRKSRPR